MARVDNSTAGLNEDAGVAVIRPSPVTGTAVLEAPELPRDGEVRQPKLDVDRSTPRVEHR